jgi:hypothetical protein
MFVLCDSIFMYITVAEYSINVPNDLLIELCVFKLQSIDQSYIICSRNVYRHKVRRIGTMPVLIIFGI